MRYWLKYMILRMILAMIPMLLAVAPAMAQNIVYAGQASDLGVIEIIGDTYTWELYNDATGVNFATDPGNCPSGDAFFTAGTSGPTVNVMWVTPGTYYFKVTASRGGCTVNLKVGEMIVLHALPTATIDPPPEICEGDPAQLTIQFTGTAPWTITVTDGTSNWNFDNIMASPYNLVVPVIPMVTTDYWITSVTDAYGTNTTESPHVTQVVKIRPVTSPISHQ